MSYSIVTNRPADATAETFSRLPVVENEYVLKENSASSVLYTNIQSPLGKPENVKYAFRRIADVYANTGIDKVYALPTKRGVEIYTQLVQNWSAIDSDNPENPEYILPVSCSISLKVPENSLISTSNVEDLLKRTLGALYAGNASHLAEFLRGAVKLIDA